MRRLYKTLLIAIIALFTLVFFHLHLSADIVILVDGTVIVGKVIKEDKEAVYLKNSYKLFNIKREQIRNSYITSTYQEDVDIHKKLGIKADETVIKKNFLAGLQKMASMEKGWNGRASVLACYYQTTGRLKDIIPYSFGALFSYDQALYNVKYIKLLTDNKNRSWFPYLRSEIGYCRYEKDEKKVDKLNISAGPIWFISFGKKNWGSIVVSSLPGLSYLDVGNNSKTATGSTFSLNSIVGYEYYEGRTTIFIQVRHVLIFDEIVNLSGIGFSIGTSYKIW